MEMTTKPLPIKYQNLLNRVGVDTTQLKYRVMGNKLLTEGIQSTDWTIIVNRKSEDKISVCMYSNPLKFVLSHEIYDFVDKTYLKEIQKLSSKYFVK
jgi:hypothetical protein